MKRAFTYLLLTSGLCLYSCMKDKVPTDLAIQCTDTVSFNSVIEPLIQTKCVECHEVGGASGGYVFEGYDNISTNASDMLDAMRGIGFTQMPIVGPALNDSLIQLFECWIYQGRLDN